MSNTKTNLLCLLFLLMFLLVFKLENIYGQQKVPINFGKVKAEDFNIHSPVIDSNTNAVVIADVGKSEFIANTTNLTFSLIFSLKKRIKIINKKGFEAATVTIPLYISTSSGKAEKLEGLKAFTYNVENGKVVETSVGKSEIFTEKRDKNWEYKKFTFPALKEGSIIEYSYQVKSDFFFNFQTWNFQGEYPVLWSQYEANIPEFFKYVILSQGYHPFFINNVEKSRVNFTFTEHVARGIGFSQQANNSGTQTFSIPGDIDLHNWVMKDIPALKPEPFTTTIRNAIAKIEFQLNEIRYPNSMPTYYMDNWEKVSRDLWEDTRFGQAIDRPNNWLDKEVENIVQGAATLKEKAQKLYAYVQKNYTCNNQERMYITDGLKEVFKNKTGSVADINMLLIAMLRNSKIVAEPVILSTRNHGYTHEIYPLMDRFNYVIASVKIDDTVTYLDATEQHLPYGKLPAQLYNGHARLISKELASPVYFEADSLKESSFTSVFISNMDNGSVEGVFNHNLGFFESLNFRDELAKTTNTEFEKSVRASFSEDFTIENITIDSLKKIDEPVQIKYGLKLKLFDEADIVYFNPMLTEAIKKNPFVAAQRYYPVEMPYREDDVYTLHMDIPKGYKVDELPKSVRFNLNDDEGMFEYIIFADAENIQMRCRVVLRKANFVNEDYESLREFYSFIVKKEAEQIVFKKIK